MDIRSPSDECILKVMVVFICLGLIDLFSKVSRTNDIHIVICCWCTGRVIYYR